jgi:UPF0176 protein
MNYKVLLFYHYTQIQNPEELQESHKLFCDEFDIKGRIILAKEGINGTISGPIEDCEIYKQYILDIFNLDTLDFKDEECDKHLFQKLTIKVKNEIIRIGTEVDVQRKTGKHLKPKEWSELIGDSDNIIIDMRSDYEHELGHFKNAITFDMRKMYQFPNIFKEHPLFSDPEIKKKKILTYCTGGIKCEKASSFFLDNGFEDVNQLEGGIIRYAKDMDGKDFDGKCYVFDDRVGIDVNKINPKIVSNCYICNTETDDMKNCMNTVCNRHTTICKDCYLKYDYCCSNECMNSETKRKVFLTI